MCIVVTGFEPFGGERINPSWEAVCRLPDFIGTRRLVRCQLPVVYQTCADGLIQVLRREKPEAVLCVGQAGGRTGITPEWAALNRMHAKSPDNAGVIATHQPIRAEGESAYFSTLPVAEMVERMRAEGIPASASYHAGTYVCNALFYRLMCYLHENNENIPAGFIHVPYACEQICREEKAAASLPLSVLVRGIELCLTQSLPAYSSDHADAAPAPAPEA